MRNNLEMQWNTNFDFVLLQSQLETQEYSFNNINKELHDNIGQLLSSTKLLLGMVSMELQSVPDALKTAEHTIGKAIRDIRLLSRSISSGMLHQFNLIENLITEKEHINANNEVQLEIKTEYYNLPMEPASQLILSRVVHAAIQTKIKFAHSKLININIENKNNCIEVSIENDAVSCELESAKKEKHILQHMQHRVELLGGIIDWKLAEQTGTVLIISVPVQCLNV